MVLSNILCSASNGLYIFPSLGCASCLHIWESGAGEDSGLRGRFWNYLCWIWEERMKNAVRLVSFYSTELWIASEVGAQWLIQWWRAVGCLIHNVVFICEWVSSFRHITGHWSSHQHLGRDLYVFDLHATLIVWRMVTKLIIFIRIVSKHVAVIHIICFVTAWISGALLLCESQVVIAIALGKLCTCMSNWGTSERRY